METAELLDISFLVSGWYRPASVEVDDQEPDVSEMPYHGADDVVPGGISIEAALAAIDAVLSVFPDARWVADRSHGRIVAGDRLVSLAVSLADPEAEFLAWIDASQRTGNGNQWRACMWHPRASDRCSEFNRKSDDGKRARRPAYMDTQRTGRI